MANELSTAGVLVKYAVESTGGTRPTAGYTAIPNIKSTPSLNPEPASIQVTDLPTQNGIATSPALKT